MKTLLYKDSKEAIEREVYFKRNPQRNMKSQDMQVDLFLEEFPEYWEYLSLNRPDVPEFPYSFFAEICLFIASEYKNGNIELIQRIFLFLERMGKSEDIDVLNLLLVGCLECFDHHKDILSELVELMPTKLKTLFLEHFSEYLD